MTQINPYLTFNGACREAMNFYKQCLGGALTLQTVAETPLGEQCPEGMKNQIMHAVLTREDMILMGTDMVGPDGFQPGMNISLSVNCDSEKEVKAFFAGLSQDGEVIEPLSEKFGTSIFGVLKDKFGINWMFNYNKDQN